MRLPGTRAPRGTARMAWIERLATGGVVVLLLNAVAEVLRGLSAPPKTDFLPFLTGAAVLKSDPGCLYCLGTQSTTQASILGYVPQAGFPEPYVNPPLAALLLRPLAGLPLRSGIAVFVIVLLIAMAAAFRMGLRLLPDAWPLPLRALVMAAAALSVPAATGLLLAQWGAILLASGLGALLCLRRGRWVAAGLLLSVLALKPQTVWLVVPLLVLAGSWRVLLGFAGGVAAWLVSGLLLVGPAQMLAWPRLVMAREVGEAQRTVGIPGIVASVSHSDLASLVVAAALFAAVAAGAFLLRSRLHGRPDVAVALGVALSLACAPHVFPDDLMLLGITAAVWAPRAPRLAVGLLLSLSAAYELDGVLPLPVAHLTAVVNLLIVGAALATLLLPARRGWSAATASGARGAEQARVPV